FEAEVSNNSLAEERRETELPEFIKNISATNIVELDVRPIIDGDGDPLNLIMKNIKELPQGKILKIINNFEPTPLISLLGRKGFKSYLKNIDAETVHAYFYKTEESENVDSAIETENAQD